MNVIVHTLQDVNDQLAQGRPFFVDIARDGIVLHEAPGFPLASPQPLTPEASGPRRSGTSIQWCPTQTFSSVCTPAPSLTVTIGRRVPPASGDGEPLPLCPAGPDALQPEAPPSDQATVTGRERRFPADPVWPHDTKFARRCFALLNRAYVDARYSPLRDHRRGVGLAGRAGERLAAMRCSDLRRTARKLGCKPAGRVSRSGGFIVQDSIVFPPR